MTSASPERKSGKIGMNPDLAMQTIKDQASSLVDGIREAYQNGIDSPNSSEVHAEIDHKRAVIWDDGDGLDLTQDYAEDLLTVLGESNKERSDDNTIGQFGVGKGQIWAKGYVVMMSGDVSIHFNVRDWGLNYEIVPLGQEVEGLCVVINYYPEEVPDEGSREWDRYMSKIRQRFMYTSFATGKKLYLNGSLISNASPLAELSNKRNRIVGNGDYVMAVEHNSTSSVAIYSNGIFVKNIDGEGLSGVIVTSRNFDLNFARNEIKSGCELFAEVKDHLEEVRKDIFDGVPSNELNMRSRETIKELMSKSQDDMIRFREKDVFEMVNDSYVSLKDIQKEDDITFSDPGIIEDKLIEHGYIVLQNIERRYLSNIPGRVPPAFNKAVRAEEEGINEGHETIHDVYLNSKQKRRLCVARSLAQRLGIEREILWGEDDRADGWTVNGDKIVITESVFKPDVKTAWMTNLYNFLCHEWAHDGPTKGSCSHDSEFNRKFRKKVENNYSIFAGVAKELDSEGFSAFVPRSGLTSKEKERIKEIEEKMNTMDVGDKFRKNGDKGYSEVVEVEDDGDLKIEGPKGGEFVVIRRTENYPLVWGPKNNTEYDLYEMVLA